jgi:hypothetical protein
VSSRRFGGAAAPGGKIAGYTAPEQYSEFCEEGQLHGGAVLPGFVLPARAWFNEAGQQSERE